MKLNPPPSTLPPGSTVWAYLRDSGGPTQDRSIQQQREEITAYAAAHNLAITRIFEDMHKSGGTTHKRTAFDEMLALSATETFRPAGLLIWNFARFARDVDDSQLYKAILRDRGITIHSLTDNIPEGPYAVIIEDIIHIADQHKKEEAALGAWRGLHHLVRQGAVPGTPPRGFKREPITVTSEQGTQRTAHRWVPDPELANRIHKAFTLRAARVPIQQIHKQTRLYNSLNSYTTFFANPLYKGELHYGDRIYPNYCTPIVPPETWDAVQLVMREYAQRQHMNDTANHPRRAGIHYLLSGIVYCARCGSPLYGYTGGWHKGQPYRSYACTRAKRRRDCAIKPIPAKKLEADVINTLDKFFQNPNNLTAALAEMQTDQQTLASRLQTELASLSSELATVRRAIANLTRSIEETGGSRALHTTLAQRETDEARLLAQITDLQTQRTEPITVPTLEQASAIAQFMRALLLNQPPEDLKATLRDIIHAIHVDRTEDNRLIGMVVYYQAKKKLTPKSHPPVGAPPFTRKLTFDVPLKKQPHR